MEKKLDQEKRSWEAHVKKSVQDDINDLENAKAITLEQLEQYQNRVTELEEVTERMNSEIRDLNRRLQQEQDKRTDLELNSLKQAQEIE